MIYRTHKKMTYSKILPLYLKNFGQLLLTKYQYLNGNIVDNNLCVRTWMVTDSWSCSSNAYFVSYEPNAEKQLCLA